MHIHEFFKEIDQVPAIRNSDSNYTVGNEIKKKKPLTQLKCEIIKLNKNDM